MSNDQIIIGVDSSTSATKVIAFDMNGKILAMGANGYPLYHDKPGWVEQDPSDWWTAFVKGCKQVMSNPNVDPSKIAGLGLTHQRFTFVPVDDQVNPLRRAILWNDIRCAEQAAYAEKVVGSKKIFERTGYPPGQWTLYKLLWLKDNEPELYERIYKLVLVQDYLIYKLTKNLVTLEGAGTMTGALDISKPSQWATDIIDALGVRSDVWISKILPGGTVAGKVTKEAAAETGLPEGLPIVTGAGDQPCGTLGAGVILPGEIAINGGTSCTNEFVSNGLPARDDVNYFIEISPSGEYIVENYIPSGGSALMNWYKDNFGYWEVTEAEKDGRSVYEIIYNQAGEAGTGNRGMMLVPYFQGANGPYWDLNARGMVVGMSNQTGRPEMVRGIIEGLAYESRLEAEFMEKGTGTEVTRIKMYGGSAKSDYWNQIFCDVFNKPLTVPDTPETTSLGAAIAAAVGCGVFPDYQSCLKSMVRDKKSYSPEPKNVEIYDKYYNRVYKKLFQSVQEHMSEVARINQEIDGK